MGNEERFQSYVLPQLEVLFEVACCMTRNGPDAEALVEETMTRAFRSMGEFDGNQPRAWLLAIMRDTQMERVQAKRSEMVEDTDEASSAATGATPVALALRALPEKFRNVVELVDFSNLTYHEAGVLLNVSEGTVMSRLHRARRNMRDDIESLTFAV